MTSLLSFATAQLVRVLPRRRVSRALGRAADRRWSAPVGRTVVALYSRIYDVALDDCEPRSGFRSFDEFFTRGLRAGARPVSSEPNVVVSPCDGRVADIGRVDERSRFHVKGGEYRVDELVGDADDARRYVGGLGAVLYLSPRDYHRVHMPARGAVTAVRSLPGDYLPVNDTGRRYFPGLFARNRRVAFVLDTPAELGLGRITLVMVSAMIVGRITMCGDAAWDVPLGTRAFAGAPTLDRGAELATFHLGSTVVLFLEPAASGRALVGEGPIRMGAALVHAARPSEAGR